MSDRLSGDDLRILMATEANYLRAKGGDESTMDKAGDTGLGETDDTHLDT